MKLATQQEQTKKKMGRPPTRRDANRTETLTIRLSPEEHRTLKLHAARSNTTMSEIIYAQVEAITAKSQDIPEDQQVTINIQTMCAVITKEEAKQILKSLTEQLLA